MVLMEKRDCERITSINVLDAFFFLFFFSQFSTPCTYITTSKSGVKILIGPFLAVWPWSSLSSICMEKFKEWLEKTSLKPSCKLETLK